ncbi:hypothetical protein PSKM_gp52 [Pantoea phage vB_PagM_PSKM]|uniref:Uncharacterized protein n=1 Tax=Pantoea phage vB_PagM_PSKM TaxID=2588094 RepID=A0A513ZYN1_9CAUD|nr:hypothetical protein HWC23_gp52 [Pantoea phage vB_PagM_PSKM]QDH45809.1 hypothetical protein PSKM_gp52 [Pantoea phage vB_PagM_PSKM]
MALINISSGIITTPNSMGATETMGYLSNMVYDQQQRKDVEISFDAFSLVESDDAEPTAPLTDEDIAQHRQDDKVDALSFNAGEHLDTLSDIPVAGPDYSDTSKGLQEYLADGWIISDANQYYSRDSFDLMYYVDFKGGNVLLTRAKKATAGAEPIHVPVTVKWVDESDCICWQCGKPQNSAALAANDFECLNCHIKVSDDLTPCITCGKVITRPGGAHYCNRKDADSTNS